MQHSRYKFSAIQIYKTFVGEIHKKIQLAKIVKIWGIFTNLERRKTISLLLFMLVGMLLETMGVGLIIPLIVLITQKDFALHYPFLQPFLKFLGNPDQYHLIVIGMCVLITAYLIKTFFLAFLAWSQAQFIFSIQSQVSQRLFSLYLHQPYLFHLQRNSAGLIHYAITEVSAFTFNGVLSGMILISEGLVLFGMSILLLFAEPTATLIILILLGLISWAFNRFNGARIIRWGKARLHHEGMRMQYMQQALGGIKDVILLGRGSDFLNQFQLQNAELARVGSLQNTLQQLPRLFLEMLAVSALVILIITMLIKESSLESLLPTLGLFTAVAFRLIPSINRFLGAEHLLRYSLPVIDVLDKELRLKTVHKTYRYNLRRNFNSSIEFNNVSYAYPNTKSLALENIALTIKCGESIGFIGTSGAGKSTLVDVLLGLLSPISGKIKVDGKDINANLREWQSQIGYVSQSIFLSDDTIRKNIAFGLPENEIDNKAVERAILNAQLNEFIDNLPNGLETIVGERGVRLSGGQKQRIGIARALYHDPAILVLDEATSSLDTKTEKDVIDAVIALKGKKTILMVTHRLSTIKHCDKVYRLEHGHLVANKNLKK